jgi:hypothetical protein
MCIRPCPTGSGNVGDALLLRPDQIAHFAEGVAAISPSILTAKHEHRHVNVCGRVRVRGFRVGLALKKAIRDDQLRADYPLNAAARCAKHCQRQG